MAQETYVFSLPKRENNDSDEDWDRYSENIRPTRRGRKIDALKQKPEEVVTDAKARETLEEIIDELNNLEDEIPRILEFCAWFEEKLPIGSHKLYYELLWKIVSRDGFIKKYAEDERILKIWEKMADNSAGHAHDIYQFAISRGSLIRCAALYVRWSQDVELSGAYIEARRVLILARTNCAMPLELIHNAEDQLELRDMRRHIEQKQSDSDDDDEESRKAFTHLPVIGEKHAVPIVRVPSLCQDTTNKFIKVDPNIEKVKSVMITNELQPFEVLQYADADDVEYLKSVHELNAHIERYAIKETNNPDLASQASTSSAASDHPIITSGAPSFEVWTIESSSKPGDDKPKARMTIKKIFRDMSMEEYCAQMPNHPSMMQSIVKKLDFDETLWI